MPQLAGAPCGVCHQPLIGVRDGAFCPECECPVHVDCVRKKNVLLPREHCRRCGSLDATAEKWRRYEDASDDERAWDARRIILVGLFPVFLLIGLRVFGFYIVIPLGLLGVAVIGYWCFKKFLLGGNEAPPPRL